MLTFFNFMNCLLYFSTYRPILVNQRSHLNASRILASGQIFFSLPDVKNGVNFVLIIFQAGFLIKKRVA